MKACAHLLGHQADQPFVGPHSHAADGVGPESHRGGEHQVLAVRFQQVDRTHVGAKPLADQPDDILQRFGRPFASKEAGRSLPK